MIKNLSHFIFFLLLACSSVTPEDRETILEQWKGHETKELNEHFYFKNLPRNTIKHADGRETWIYRDQSTYQSAAYCQSLGGCMGIPFYNCDTAFSIKDGIILGAEQNGACPPIATIKIK